MKQICFITPEYPIEGDMINTFVDSLICEFSRRDIKCVVISPFDFLRFLSKKGKYRKSHWIRNVDNKHSIEIFEPRFFGALGNKHFGSLSRKIYNCIVIRKFKQLSKKYKFDAVYGHFFGTGGLAAQLIGQKYSIPSFVACGESSLAKLYKYEKKDDFLKCIKKITGVICVSSKNKEEIKCTWFDDVTEWEDVKPKIQVIPNAFSLKEFFLLDKKDARKRVGLPNEGFIVTFLGRFQEHKGINEFQEALNHCDDVFSVFLGSGSIKPNCKGMLFCGEVNHSDIVYYLNASDVFVLPTKAEGCSNAIVEALACHLPIVSSDMPFNYDILKNDYNSILINPNSSKEIQNAIMELKNNHARRNKMADNAGVTAKQLTLSNRVDRIISFMIRCIGET